MLKIIFYTLMEKYLSTILQCHMQFSAHPKLQEVGFKEELKKEGIEYQKSVYSYEYSYGTSA
jgi:hypothetical protein